MVPREELDVDTLWALKFWQDTLPDAKPREVHLAGFRQPLVIFSDGCCDPSFSSPSGVKAGYGGIMFDPEDNAYEFFRKDMSEDLKWYLSLQGSKKQIVGQAEVLPCLLARLIWKERMKNRAVLYFVDNEAARFGLIRGGAKEPHMGQMLSAFWDEEKDNPSYPWFARVPTLGNPADDPSRGLPPCTLCSHSKMPIKPTEVSVPPTFEGDYLSVWSEGVEITPDGLLDLRG